MASKGQKFKKYSPEFKEEILNKYFSGETMRNLEKEYGVPKGTLLTWTYNKKHYKGISFPGRPKKAGLKADDYKERYEILKKFQVFLQAQREKK